MPMTKVEARTAAAAEGQEPQQLEMAGGECEDCMEE